MAQKKKQQIRKLKTASGLVYVHQVIVMPSSGPSQIQQQGSDGSDGGLKHTTDNKMDSLSHNVGQKSSAADSIPVIPKMNFANTANGTTANVTIPVCNGVVGGPCLDPNTHTIIP
jgi:hypothetical protein